MKSHSDLIREREGCFGLLVSFVEYLLFIIIGSIFVVIPVWVVATLLQQISYP